MRWQIEGFVFCDKHQSLTRQDEVQQLEPILVALLSYFCQHPNKIISRNELVESVWLGRTVTDSAVNRAITKLRKCLGDTPKAPRFIATFPKKGYKLIADVAQIESDTQQAAQPGPALGKTDNGNQSRHTVTAFLVACVLSLVVSVIWLGKRSDGPALLTEAKPLTRAIGQEWHPSVSPDQRFLTYTEVIDNKMHLFIKQLSDGRKIEIHPDNDPAVWVGPASWNNSGNQIVYLVASKDSCRYYLQTVSQLTLGEAKLIHNCPAGSYGKIAFTHSDTTLVYSERRDEHAPYELFEYDLSTGRKRKLTQPPLVLGGNLFFDLHPTQNTLLVSSPDEQLWEGFYAVDLDTDTMTLLFSLDSYICCGIWDHTGERVVLMGEHPATQLISYDLQGKDRQVVYAGSQQLHWPQRHPNKRDYLFPAGGRNLDVKLFTTDEQETHVLTQTSVDDRLAAVSPSNEQLAYVGLASGAEEIWLSGLYDGNSHQLTQFNDQRHYVDLTWSPAGEKLAALTLNEVHIIDINTGQSRTLQIPQTEIRAISFKDANTLYFSVKRRGRWQVSHYDLSTDELQSMDEKWQFVRFDALDENTLWLDQQNNLYETLAAIPVNTPALKLVDALPGRRFNLRKYAGTWYWQQWDTDQYQMFTLAQQDARPSALIRTDVPHFDVFKTGVVYHALKSRNTDIFQTVARQ